MGRGTPGPLLAALAAGTQRVQLGPLVACTAFHPPGLIARMAAALAEVSGGRFVLGLGAGWNEEEFRAFGLPYDHRVSRFEESFTIIRRLLAGERVTLDGSYAQAQDAVLLPAPPAPPPLMIGSNGPRMLGIALPHVDAWNTWYEDFGNTPEGFAALNDRISAAARDAGRDPSEIERSACVYVALDRSDEEHGRTPDAPPLEGPASEIASRLERIRRGRRRRGDPGREPDHGTVDSPAGRSPGGSAVAVVAGRRALALHHLDHVAPAVGLGAVDVGEAVDLRELAAGQRLPVPARPVGIGRPARPRRGRRSGATRRCRNAAYARSRRASSTRSRCGARASARSASSRA